MPANPIYKFHAELMDTNLKIWREFEVVNNYPMSKLGYIIMAIFRMQGSHLFNFAKENEGEYPNENYIDVLKEFAKNNVETKDRKQFLEVVKEAFNPESDEFVKEMFELRHKRYFYEIPNPYEDDINPYQIRFNAIKTKLSQVVTEVGETIIFNYDFSDNWEIKITLKEIYTDKEIHFRAFPRVLDGAGYGIIEDCGGVAGLENLVEVYTKKCGEEYKNYVEWLGVTDFDIDEFNLNEMTYVAKCANVWFKDEYEKFDD